MDIKLHPPNKSTQKLKLTKKLDSSVCTSIYPNPWQLIVRANRSNKSKVEFTVFSPNNWPIALLFSFFYFEYLSCVHSCNGMEFFFKPGLLRYYKYNRNILNIHTNAYTPTTTSIQRTTSAHAKPINYIHTTCPFGEQLNPTRLHKRQTHRSIIRASPIIELSVWLLVKLVVRSKLYNSGLLFVYKFFIIIFNHVSSSLF